MSCQSVFVRGEMEAHDSAGAYLDVTHFPRFPESLASVCHDSTWHMTGKGLLRRSSQENTSDNQLTWLTHSLIHWLTGWLTDDPGVEGCGATQMISKEDKQAAEWKWRGEWNKLAHGKLLCLFGKWPTLLHTKSGAICDPSDTLPRTASAPLQPPPPPNLESQK